MCSWLARLGWSHGDDEVFTLDELASLFDLDAVGRSAGQANFGKLDWQNQQFLARLDGEELFARVRPFLEAATGRAATYVDVAGLGPPAFPPRPPPRNRGCACPARPPRPATTARPSLSATAST